MRYFDDGGPPRVAYAIGRAHGTAVTRNRARRRLRAALAPLEGTPALPGGAYLIGLRRPLDERTFAQVEADLERCLSQVRPG